MQKITHSVSQTTNFGLSLAKKAHGGEIYALHGDLGGGKTSFAKGFAKGLGVQSVVASPSFILMKVYPIKSPTIKHLCHVDTYRLHSPQEIIEVGLKEYLGRPDTVTIIEWADKLNTVLGAYHRTELHFSFVDTNTRKIVVTKKTPR